MERQKSLGYKANETDIKSLVDMGFSRAQVEEALSICDGNKEDAATYLTNQQARQSPKQ